MHLSFMIRHRNMLKEALLKQQYKKVRSCSHFYNFVAKRHCGLFNCQISRGSHGCPSNAFKWFFMETRISISHSKHKENTSVCFYLQWIGAKCTTECCRASVGAEMGRVWSLVWSFVSASLFKNKGGCWRKSYDIIFPSLA